MSVFGLVHGGGLGSWCWELLIPELKAQGHQVATVNLSEDLSAGASRFSEVVLEAFAGIDNLILVGHSNAGLIIPLVAQKRSVKRLVFLHALLPQPSQSVIDQFEADAEIFNPEILKIQDNWWEDESVVAYFLFHDCSSEIAQDAFTRLRPEGQVITTEITPLKSYPNVPCSYIVCIDDRIVTPAWARRAARQRLGVEPIEISGGHCPFLSRPQQLAETLNQVG